MCGVAGFILANPVASTEVLHATARTLALALRHRGPDDSGTWVDADAGLALGHARLAILDLSPAGHQPMVSASGRYVIAFNGEIYNHLELRVDLEAAGAAPTWRGHADTETLLAGVESWGVEASLRRCVGMFAFALWDRRTRTLTLARDRFGEKPLYYGWIDGHFVFGSELKALRLFPEFDNPICRSALAAYLRYRYVPAPWSIYQGLYKLEPGCLLTLRGQAPTMPPKEPLRPDDHWRSVTLRRWWSLCSVVEAGRRDPLVDESDALAALDERLSEAVRLQSLADVPVGAFLSGGVDSSLIVALMQRQSSRPIRTFTIGFDEAGYDEAPFARAVAAHLGTDHSELRVSAADARAVIGELPVMYDEPFGDSSQLPTHLVCRAARQAVTVALSGDAGDELFGGYNRYRWGPRVWSQVAGLPLPVRQGLGRAISLIPVTGWEAFGGLMQRLVPRAAGVARVSEQVAKLGDRLGRVKDMDEFYISLATAWQVPPLARDGSAPTFTDLGLFTPPASLGTAEERMMFWDAVTYLPGDILCKVDRAAMAIGLETRVPFLDHRIAELAWRLPLHLKVRGTTGKWVLRRLLDTLVPRTLIERPKAGFTMPVGEWLRGSLRPWAEALLDVDRLSREGYLDPLPIQRLWARHLTGRHDEMPRLWAVLMFQAWLETAMIER